MLSARSRSDPGAALGYMLGNLSIRQYSLRLGAVKICAVQMISRKDQASLESSETIRRASVSTIVGVDEEIVRAAWRHAEAGRNVLPLDL